MDVVILNLVKAFDKLLHNKPFGKVEKLRNITKVGSYCIYM